MDGQSSNAPEPQDIAQAFQMLRTGNQEPAQADEPAAEPLAEDVGGAVPDGGAEPEPEAGAADPGIQDVGIDAGGDDGAGAGGSPAGNAPVDYGSSRDGLIRNIQQQAVREIADEFKKHGVKSMSMSDIYRRDEDGTVHFDNPDNPRAEFQSRAEAQAWIDSMNKEIAKTFNDEVRKKTQELYNQAQPAIMLLEFAPTYDAMDDDIKAVFNDLVEPYSVYNANGDIVGFSCNLNRMAVQAQNIASRFGKQKGQQQDNAPVSVSKDQGPALDIKTGSGQQGADETEPKTVEEAMALLQKQRRQNG